MKFSIITPSFNQGKFIERTIQSVLQQEGDIEYIVIDGGSTDETLSILKSYASNLHYISEKDHGQAHAVNKGLQISSGDVIGWLNSDDIYYSDTLKKIADFFARHPDIDVVYGGAYHIDANDQILETYPTRPWDLNYLMQECYLSQPAVFWRRSLISTVGLLDEQLHFCMDYEYWLRLGLKGARFVYLTEILAGSRLYPQTKTMSSPLKATEETLKMLKRKLGYVPQRWVINYAVLSAKKNPSGSQLQFLIKCGWFAISQGFKWNGFYRGLMSFFTLPFQALLLKYKRFAAKIDE